MSEGGSSRMSEEGPSDLKVAIVCDWLTNVGGAEKVLLRIHQLFPEAPIYTSKYDKKGIDWFEDAEVRTGWLQIFPSKMRRILGALRQKYFEKLDLSEYDLVISVTGAEAKAVKVPNGVHISYCHVPTQYYWQMYDDYVKNPGFGVLNPLVRVCFKAMVKPLKKADYRAAQGVDHFVTISDYAQGLIRKYYKRESVVVHPPVEICDFAIKSGDCQKEQGNKRGKSQGVGKAEAKNKIEKSQEAGNAQVVENFYVTTSRQVTWKRLDLAVKAAIKAKVPLVVIGEGPEHEKLVKIADNSPLVKFLPLMRKQELAEYLRKARGYLFPSMEPFGIAPVEALAAGCPVIAFCEGGAKDYVIPGKNGVLFEKQTVGSLAAAILEFEEMKFDRGEVSGTADKFGVERFDAELMGVVRGCKK